MTVATFPDGLVDRVWCDLRVSFGGTTVPIRRSPAEQNNQRQNRQASPEGLAVKPVQGKPLPGGTQSIDRSTALDQRGEAPPNLVPRAGKESQHTLMNTRHDNEPVDVRIRINWRWVAVAAVILFGVVQYRRAMDHAQREAEKAADEHMAELCDAAPIWDFCYD